MDRIERLAERVARTARFSPMVTFNVGDLVDAGPYGELWVTSLGGGSVVWVSPDQGDVARGLGRAIRRELIRRVVRFASARTADWRDRADAVHAAEDDVSFLEGAVERALRKEGVEYRRVDVGRPIGGWHEANIRVELRRLPRDDEMLMVFNSCYAGFQEWAAKHGLLEASYKQTKSGPRTYGVSVGYK
jgi:hypothetical protein